MTARQMEAVRRAAETNRLRCTFGSVCDSTIAMLHEERKARGLSMDRFLHLMARAAALARKDHHAP
jgi:hypothetical protein